MVRREASCFSGCSTSPLPSQHHGIQTSWNWLLHWLMAQPSFGMPWQVGTGELVFLLESDDDDDDDDDDADDDFFDFDFDASCDDERKRRNSRCFPEQNQSVSHQNNWFQQKINVFFSSPGPGHACISYLCFFPKILFGKVNNW